MGFVFLSYLYTLDISGSNKAPADDVIILHKSSVVKYKDSSFDEGKLLVKISFHQPGKPAAVLEHYKSMRTGEVSQDATLRDGVMVLITMRDGLW